MGRVRTLLLSFLLLNCGCKNTEDYLGDLAVAAQGSRKGESSLDVYDADVLIHEGFAGIMEQPTLTLSQMGRAIYYAGLVGANNKSVLLRCDALAALTHIALRYPIPAVVEPYDDKPRMESIATDAINRFDEAIKPLGAAQHIAGMSSPDKVVAEENWFTLRKLTGQELPQDVGVWEDWWDKSSAAFIAKAQAEARPALSELKYLKYRSARSSGAVLGYLATTLVSVEFPDLEEEMRLTLSRLARQVITYAIRDALLDRFSPVVRSEAARSAAQVLDPAFGPALSFAYARETDTNTKVQFLKALRWYPTSTSIQLCVLAASDRDRAVSLTARQVLSEFAGKDLGEDPTAWNVWWEREGKIRWP